MAYGHLLIRTFISSNSFNKWTDLLKNDFYQLAQVLNCPRTNCTSTQCRINNVCVTYANLPAIPFITEPAPSQAPTQAPSQAPTQAPSQAPTQAPCNGSNCGMPFMAVQHTAVLHSCFSQCCTVRAVDLLTVPLSE